MFNSIYFFLEKIHFFYNFFIDMIIMYNLCLQKKLSQILLLISVHE